MPERQYESDLALREKLVAGVNKLANNVASTYGPRGRNVILHQKGANPIITKDGITVAEFVKLSDPFENAAAQIIKQSAAKTASDAGDGTTTATILARSIFNEAQKYITSGASPTEIKRGIDKTVELIVQGLKDIARPIQSKEDIEHIATISANGDIAIGQLIATAVDLVGKDGAITIEEARSVETSLDLVEGFRFDSGYLSSKFINDERRGVVRHEDPLVLVTDFSVESVEELLPVLEIIARDGRPLVIVAENVEGQALAALIMNSIRGSLKVAAIKAPRYGEERRNILKDLAASMGAAFVSRESGLTLKTTGIEHLGTAKTIEISKSWTTMVGGNGDVDEIDRRIDNLKTEIDQTDSINECQKIQERITRLASGIAIIRVGGATEIEMIEKRHRIEDALEAVRSAQQEGVVPGGGVALVRVVQGLEIELDNEDQEIGNHIIMAAVLEPVRQMALNAGESADIVAELVKNCDHELGYNFKEARLVNMLEAGIIDPVKVTRCALQNAASAATTLFTTNYAIIEA
jgi:chaperonin GroEL